MTHSRAAVRREIRELIRHPPIRLDDAERVVDAVLGGLTLPQVYEIAGYTERRLIVDWRMRYPTFDSAVTAAEAVQEWRKVNAVADLIETGTPATVKAIRRKTFCTPKEAQRWIKAALPMVRPD